MKKNIKKNCDKKEENCGKILMVNYKERLDCGMGKKAWNKKLWQRIIGLMYRFTILLIFFTFFSIATPTTAQNFGSAKSFDISISPENPGENEEVSVLVTSSSIDLKRSQLSWVINGVVVREGIGETRHSFETGRFGELINLEVVARSAAGTVVSVTKSINPSSVDLIWQADTYTPALYKGKSLLSSESDIRITAVPHLYKNGSPVEPENLVYNWEKDGVPLPELSGFGERILEIKGPKLLGEDTIRVTVSDLDKTVFAKEAIKISAVEPFIIFYEEDPEKGTLYKNPLGENFSLEAESLGIRAEPYFFSNKIFDTRNSDISWTVNGESVAPSIDNPFLIVLRQTGGAGRAVLRLAVEFLPAFLQEATMSLVVSFGR